MGGTTSTVALACWRLALRGTWRQVLALALLAGLLGGGSPRGSGWRAAHRRRL